MNFSHVLVLGCQTKYLVRCVYAKSLNNCVKVSLACIEALFEPTMQMFSTNNWKLAHFFVETAEACGFCLVRLWIKKNQRQHKNLKSKTRKIFSTTFAYQKNLKNYKINYIWFTDVFFQYCSVNNTNNECKLLGLFSNKAFWKENDMMINCPCLACSPWQTDTQQTCSATQTLYAYYSQNVSCFKLIHLK